MQPSSATPTTAATTTGDEAMRGWERVDADGDVGIDASAGRRSSLLPARTRTTTSTSGTRE